MSQHYFETHGGGDFDGFDEDEEARMYNGGLDGDDDPDGFDEHEEALTRLEYGHLYDEGASEGAFDSDDESRDRDGFLDDEASEAESDLESEQSDRQNTAIFPDTMDHFMRLPIELREMIWKQFCPDLSNNPRVFEITFDDNLPTFAAQIEYQTEQLRRVLAVHQESRRLAQNFAPHLIKLPKNRGVAPCHMERDIVLADWKFDHRYSPGDHELDMLASIAPGLQNLAVPAGVTFFDGGPDLDRLYSLRNVFVTQDAEMIPTIGLTWCLSDTTRSYHVVHPEDVGNGLIEELDMFFFWPDPENHDEFGERSFNSRSFGSLQFDEEGQAVNDEGEIIGGNSSRPYSTSNWGYEIQRLREWLDPLHEMNNRTLARLSHSGSSSESEDRGEQDSEPAHEDHEDRQETREQTVLPQPQRISVWPLARFEFAEGVRRLEAMDAWQQPWEEWESEGGSDDFEEGWDDEDEDLDSLDGFIAPDEPFDSEVDDDDEEESLIDEEVGAGAPDDHSAQDQNVHVESAEEEESATEPGDSSRGGHDNETVIDLVDSSEREEGEEEEEEGEDAIIIRSRGIANAGRRVRGRHIPLDSEDEDEDGNDEEEDDDDLPQATRNGGRRVAIPSSSESEDNDNEEDIDNPQTGGPTTTTSRVQDDESEEPSSEEEEDDSEEEEEEEEETTPPPATRMSLAKRLRLEAAQARAEALAADDSDDEEDQDGDASDDEADASEDGEEMGMGLVDEDDEVDDYE